MGVGGGGGGKWSNSPVWCVGGSLCDMNEGHTFELSIQHPNQCMLVGVICNHFSG